jgi:mRNA interferase MazF
MRRGEVWWADLPPPAGKRPVVLLSRDEAYPVRALVTIAPVTTRVRGIPVEVPLGATEGLPKECVANVDAATTIAKSALTDRAGALDRAKIKLLDRALKFALGLDPTSRP